MIESNKLWMLFLEKGHEIMALEKELKKQTVEDWKSAGVKYATGINVGDTPYPKPKIHFTVEELDFELGYSNGHGTGWFALYKVTPFEGGGESKLMINGEFYGLGRKDVHDMADDGVQHILDYRKLNGMNEDEV